MLCGSGGGLSVVRDRLRPGCSHSARRYAGLRGSSRPPASDLDVRLIGEPPVTGNVAARPGGLDELRREPLHPSVDGDVIDGDARARRAVLRRRGRTGRTAGTSGPRLRSPQAGTGSLRIQRSCRVQSPDQSPAIRDRPTQQCRSAYISTFLCAVQREHSLHVPVNVVLRVIGSGERKKLLPSSVGPAINAASSVPSLLPSSSFHSAGQRKGHIGSATGKKAKHLRLASARCGCNHGVRGGRAGGHRGCGRGACPRGAAVTQCGGRPHPPTRHQAGRAHRPRDPWPALGTPSRWLRLQLRHPHRRHAVVLGG